jgi:hypothetical protein
MLLCRPEHTASGRDAAAARMGRECAGIHAPRTDSIAAPSGCPNELACNAPAVAASRWLGGLRPSPPIRGALQVAANLAPAAADCGPLDET